MTISIFKFGGSCFKNPEAFGQIKDIMDLHLKKGEKMVFVASALQGITDKLIETAKNASNPEKLEELINEIKDTHVSTINEIFEQSPEVKRGATNFIKLKMKEIKKVLSEVNEFGLQSYFKDYIMSFGEKMSTYLLYLYVKINNNPDGAEYVTGEDIIITNSNYNSALPYWNYTNARIKNLMKGVIDDPNNNKIFCVTGFIGRNRVGFTTTLGRGGSDFTATIISRALYDCCDDKDVRVVLWKDVDGILATNPKYAKDPKLIKDLSYDEAKEMAFYGAKVIHPKCLFGLDERKIKVEIRPFDNPNSEIYSTIGEISGGDDITGISTIEDIALLSVSSGPLVSTPGVLAKIFAIMGNNDINVSMVAQSSSEVNTTFVVEKEDGEKAFNLIKANDFFEGWAEIDLKFVSILAITGKGISKSTVQAQVFKSLADEKINIIAMSQSSDGLNLSMVINKEMISKAVHVLNECSKCM